MLLTIGLELLIAIKVEKKCTPSTSYSRSVECLLTSPRSDCTYYITYTCNRDSIGGNRVSNITDVGNKLLTAKERGILLPIRFKRRLGSL